MSNKMIIQSISGIRKKVDAKDYARVVLLYLSCYEVSLKDQNNLISSISEPTLQEAVENLSLVLEQGSGTEIRRRVAMISKQQFKEY